MNNSELAWAVLVEPKRAFTALREQPRFWFPLLATAFACTALFAWYYSTVDIAWLSAHILDSDLRTKAMSDAERTAATATMTRGFLLGTSLLAIVLGTAILRVVEAAYFLLAGRAMAVPLSFKQWMALTCWSAWPHVLLVFVMSVAVITHGNGQIGSEQLNLLSLNELFFHTPTGHTWNPLLNTLTLLHPWVWWLTVLGAHAWSGRSWTFSAVFALLPVAALYGVWALMAFIS